MEYPLSASVRLAACSWATNPELLACQFIEPVRGKGPLQNQHFGGFWFNSLTVQPLTLFPVVPHVFCTWTIPLRSPVRVPFTASATYS